jgi:bifunctional DNA-binding transcriptional regulator/antitoxin component of YhaV-PrlF toxin-antitoxin module
MTKSYRSRVGPKGQVVILKRLRERYGIKEGRLVEQVATSRGLLLIPVSGEQLMKDLETVAKEIGRIWPPGKSAVEVIREERDKRWSRK